MELSLVNSSAIKISHAGDSVIYPIGGANSFERSALVKIVEDDQKNPYDPFGDINKYMRTLPRAEQKKIFDVYVNVNENFIDVLGLDELKDFLTDAFTKIYDVVVIDEVEAYMNKHNMIYIPVDVEENEADHYKEERTYTPDKYRGLIALATVTRLAVPIWGAYIRFITKGTGVGRKEIHCAQLLRNSTLVQSKQYDEFVNFVVYTYAVGETKTDSVLTGFGTEEQATLLPAAVLIRKIAVAPNLKSKSAVKEAFTYVVYDGPGPWRKHPYIRAKSIEKGTLVEERALLETYQVKESISAGDLELIAYYCEEIPLVLKTICPDISDELINEAIRLRDHLVKKEFKPTLANIRLVQFFIKEIPPQIVPQLDSKDLIELMRFSQMEHRRDVENRIRNLQDDVVVDHEKIAKLKESIQTMINPDDYATHAKESLLAILFTVLIHKGYPSIALMCTAIETEVDGIDTTVGNSRKQIPAEIDAQLDELFPLRISGGKDSVNMVKDAISRYFNQFSGMSYYSVYTDYFKPFVEHLEDREGNHYLRPETPISLAKITIEIYK